MEIAKLLTVLGLGIVELWAAIPTGLALNLHPVLTGAIATAGAWMGALAVIVLGVRAQVWLKGRFGGNEEKGRHGSLARIWRRYGVIGLGLRPTSFT